MKILLIILALSGFTQAKTDRPNVDLAIAELQKKIYSSSKDEKYHNELLTLQKKYPKYLPLQITIIHSLNEKGLSELAQELYKNLWEKKKTSESEFLYLYSQIGSWSISPLKRSEMLNKIEKLAQKKDPKSDINYIIHLTILKRSGNTKQKETATAYMLKHFPKDESFLRVYPRIQAATGMLDDLITQCEKELQDLKSKLISCNSITSAQVDQSDDQKAKIDKLTSLAKVQLPLAKEMDYLTSLYSFVDSLDNEALKLEIAKKIVSIKDEWIPYESLRQQLGVRNYDEFKLFDGLYTIVSMPDVKSKIAALKKQFDKLEDHKEITNYLYKSLVGSYLHPTIKDNDEAIDTLEEWLEFDKDNDYAKSKLAELYLKEKENLEKALILINDSIAFHDESVKKKQKYFPKYNDFLHYSNRSLADLYKQKGEIFQAMDKYDRSIEYLKISFSLNPSNEVAYYIYKATKEIESHRESFEWALIALVETKNPLSKEEQSLLKESIKSHSLKMTSHKINDITIKQLTEQKKTLYHLGESKEDNEEELHPLIGKDMIQLPYNTLKKKPFIWKSLKGKNVLLSFWATWCVPCIQELTVLDKLKREYKGKPFEVVAICTDGLSKKKEMHKILKKAKIKNLEVLVGKSDAMDIYGFNAIPTSFYVNPEGKIIDKGQGYSENLEKEIKEKLNL